MREVYNAHVVLSAWSWDAHMVCSNSQITCIVCLLLLTKHTVSTGASAVAQPQINLTAVSAAANAAYGTTLSPMFNYYSSDVTGLLSAFIFEDVGVTAYNGAAPLISDKTLLAAAVGIGLIEGYHAGIVS